MNKFIRSIICILGLILFTSLVTTGCIKKENEAAPEVMPTASEQSKSNEPVIKDVDIDQLEQSNMISYDITDVGRSDPFMPYGEYQAMENARLSAIQEANRHNAQVAEYQQKADVKIREADDISPYSFNLPVPPTKMARWNDAAAKITRTKVVGIMYNEVSPSAIINVDNKDYLVRPGDKIIDQEYKVVKINKNWITVSLGSNVYSAAIGELFSKDGLDESKNDLYNMENRFGGRRS